MLPPAFLRRISAPALLTTLLLALNFPASAQSSLKTLGFDDMSCDAWKQSKGDEAQRTLYITWIRGLLTGHNYAHPGEQVSTISSGTIEQWIERYCKDNPKDGFNDGALRLSDQFSGRRKPITK